MSELPGMVILSHPSKCVLLTHLSFTLFHLNTGFILPNPTAHPCTFAYSFTETLSQGISPISPAMGFSPNALLLAYLGCWVIHTDSQSCVSCSTAFEEEGQPGKAWEQ